MKRRHGFTLVELLVSMALIIFIMAILSQAFIAALGTFRNLKGQGDMAEKLRATMQILQNDLAANHFDGNRRLSDPTFWNNGPPQQGFFQIWQGSTGTKESTLGDPSGIFSYVSTNHTLAFTVRLVGNDMGNFMSAGPLGSGNIWVPGPPPTPGATPVVPQLQNGIGGIQTFGPPESRYQLTSGSAGFTYNSQWAEVAWYLQPQVNPTTLAPDTTAPDPTAGTPAIPLYSLYRRQRLLVPDNNPVSMATVPLGGVPNVEPPGGPIPPGIQTSGYYLEMSCWPNPSPLAPPPAYWSGHQYFNNPLDITVPQRRFGGNIPTSPATTGGYFPPFPPTQPSPTANGTSGYPPLSATIASTPGAQIVYNGADIQLNDVVSFDVRVLPMYPVGTGPLNPADPFITLWDYPLNTVGANISPWTYISPYQNPPYVNPNPAVMGMVFDTWSSLKDGLIDYSTWNTGVPGIKIPFWTTNPVIYQYPVGNTTVGETITTPATGSGPIIRAIQITIRIWDFKTNQTRQVTIVQAM